MKLIIRPRRTGRTEELIRMCAETERKGEVSYIVCADHRDSYRIAQTAEKLDLIIGFPITFEEFLNHQYFGKSIKNFYIDNVDLLLQSLTSATIQAVTLEEK